MRVGTTLDLEDKSSTLIEVMTAARDNLSTATRRKWALDRIAISFQREPKILLTAELKAI
jgi:hypothetical protein